MSEAAAIAIDNLTVWFERRKILEGFSLRLAPGEKVALTGRSGSGKSTILRCILGFIVPEAGTVHIYGKPLTSDTVWELRTDLAYVAQEPDLGTGRVKEILERPFTYRANANLKGNLARVPELFERFLVPLDLLDKDVATLSGGEKQRVGLISAVLLDRRIFLLDEAASALDKASKKAVAEFFRSRKEISVFSVSHDPESFYFPDRIIELTGGYEGSNEYR